MTDRRRSAVPLVDAVAAALRGGVTAVMLREKDLATEELVRIGRPVARACREAGALFLVNHDPDAARALGADGVHLGFRSPSPRGVRASLGDAPVIGASTHDLVELRRALEEGVEYVTFGPVYDTASKRGILEPRGPQTLAAAVTAAGACPVIALGGVTPSRAAAVRAAGAAGMACIGAILDSSEPEEAARALRRAWGSE